MLKSPCKDFFHRGIVIWPHYSLDFKLPIVILLRLAVFKYYHRANIFIATGVGYIVGFYPLYII